MKVCVVLSVLFLLMVLPARGDLYTWIDSNGVKHFSNEPPPIKKGVKQQAEIKHSAEQYDQWEEQRQSDQSKMLEGNRPDEKSQEKAASAAGRVTKRPGRVVIYTTPKCRYCAQAKAFFKKYAISYTEYDITTDSKAKRRFKELKGNGIPLIFVGKKRIPGFNEGLMKSLFGIR